LFSIVQSLSRTASKYNYFTMKLVPPGKRSAI
jgi:hypothetical protein